MKELKYDLKIHAKQAKPFWEHESDIKKERKADKLKRDKRKNKRKEWE